MNEGIIMAVVTLVTNTITYFVTNKYKRKKESFEIIKESSDYYLDTNNTLLKEIEERSKQVIELNGRIIILERENRSLQVQLEETKKICEDNAKTINELKSLVESLKHLSKL